MIGGLLQTSRMRGRLQLTLEAIRRHYYAYGCAPSFSELGAYVDAPPSRVSAMVRQLAAMGAIGHTPGVARSITLPRSLANYADSELLLELQARGYLMQPVSAGHPLSVLTVTADTDLQNCLNQLDAVPVADKLQVADD